MHLYPSVPAGQPMISLVHATLTACPSAAVSHSVTPCCSTGLLGWARYKFAGNFILSAFGVMYSNASEWYKLPPTTAENGFFMILSSGSLPFAFRCRLLHHALVCQGKVAVVYDVWKRCFLSR